MYLKNMQYTSKLQVLPQAYFVHCPLYIFTCITGFSRSTLGTNIGMGHYLLIDLKGVNEL